MSGTCPVCGHVVRLYFGPRWAARWRLRLHDRNTGGAANLADDATWCEGWGRTPADTRDDVT